MKKIIWIIAIVAIALIAGCFIWSSLSLVISIAAITISALIVMLFVCTVMGNLTLKMMEKDRLQELSQLEKEEMVAVNAYYVLAEASDMMLRHVEFLLDLKKRGLRLDVKQRHKRIMDRIQVLKTEYLNFQSCYDRSFNGDYEKQDDVRKSAAYISRLLLLVSDRCYTTKKGGE